MKFNSFQARALSVPPIRGSNPTTSSPHCRTLPWVPLRLRVFAGNSSPAAASSPVPARTPAQQWGWCRADDPEHLISGCSAVIRAGHEKPDILARAFAHRGRAWSDKGQFDRAIRDLDNAIRLDPQFAD